MSERGTGDRVTEAGLLCMAVIWGVNFAVIKAVLFEVHPFVFNSLRFPLAAAALLVLLRSSQGRGAIRLPERGDRLRIVGLGLLGNVAYQFLFILGIDRTTAGNASLLLATTPVWTLLLSVAARHEAPEPRVWLGVAGTFIGMALVVAGGRSALTAPGAGPAVEGDLLMVGAAFTWAVYTVGGRDLVRKYGALSTTSWTLWVGTPVLVLLGVPWIEPERIARLSPTAWAGVAYAGIFALALAYLFWYRGVRKIGSSRTAVYSNVVPVVALGVAWIWLGEVPGPLQWVGAVAVVAGVTATRRRGKVRPTQPGRALPSSSPDNSRR